jgi:hypothetical protein
VAELLTVQFQDPATLIVAPTRPSDDLPAHVKGIATWRTEQGTEGPYQIPIGDSGILAPAEFIDDHWYFLIVEGQQYKTAPEHQLAKYELGTGWWQETDAQHPMNRRIQELSQIRDNGPAETTTEESDSEEEPELPSPPPGYGRRSPTAAEQREMELLAQLAEAQATIATTTTQTMEDVQVEAGPSRQPAGGLPPPGPPGGGWPGAGTANIG